MKEPHVRWAGCDGFGRNNFCDELQRSICDRLLFNR
jgi:hypothetical protein